LAPRDLEASLRNLPRQSIPEVLVGYENSDDGGVYLLRDDLALVQTIDFFSPVVDDAYSYGQIAAANALSDIYAMGGLPKTALSVVAFPANGVDFSVLGEILRGGLDKLTEAGVALLGGHSVRDDEIKFGYSVTGTVDPRKIKDNSKAQPNAALILTKPLGTGLITTAIKKGVAETQHVEAAVEIMCQLNRTAAQICGDLDVDTMTDITGFGLVGHALEVAQASNISIEIDHRRLPVLKGALDYARRGMCAGGLTSNREYFIDRADIAANVAEEYARLVFDPQTSGGLLTFVPSSRAAELLGALQSAGISAVEIGRTLQRQPIFIRVI
jgi:selenide, water dikinase